MRRLFLLITILFISYSANGQTYLKANTVYYVVGIPNLSVETKLAERWTFNGEILYSPWKSITGNRFEFGQLIPEVRYYFDESFKGIYVGGYASFHLFNMTKWNYWNKGKYQKGWGYSFGATIGYNVQINKRWNLDVYMGAGWQNSQYRGYDSRTGEMYINWNGSGEWLPYRLGITFAYRL